MSKEQPLLAVEGLNAYYGSAHVLQNVSFELGEQAVALVGRNGMGKTTLCTAIMGISPPRATGSVKFRGKELVGRSSYKIAGLGIGYVPQGRRLFPSLTVDEHLRMAASSRNGDRRWTPDAVYELFPRLAERKRNGGAQLSGGEQQMLAIGRALVTNPRLLILDEATEGLAPLVREQIWRALERLRANGIAMIVIDKYVQRLIAIGDRHCILEKGRGVWQGSSDALDADRSLWQRYLGV